MTIIEAEQDNESGHWYSPQAVAEMLAAERERCHTHAARALDSATEGEWADAAMSLLAISKGDAA